MILTWSTKNQKTSFWNVKKIGHLAAETITYKQANKYVTMLSNKQKSRQKQTQCLRSDILNAQIGYGLGQAIWKRSNSIVHATQNYLGACIGQIPEIKGFGAPLLRNSARPAADDGRTSKGRRRDRHLHLLFTLSCQEGLYLKLRD